MNLFTVDVYEPDATTYIATLVKRDGVGFLHELNGDGSGSYRISLDDATLAAHPTLLDQGNVVKVKLGGSVLFGWIQGKPEKSYQNSEEAAGRQATVNGLGMRSILQSTVVFPENQGTGQPYDLRDTFSENRPTDFSSYDGPWRVTADWDTPVGSLQSTHPPSGKYPYSWVDPTAYWIWSTDPLSSALLEINYFRAEFTLATDTVVGVWATGDNRILSLRLDGEEIAADDPAELYGFKKTNAAQPVPLAAGTHTIAASVQNRSGAGGFLCTLGTVDLEGDLDTVILNTNTTDWEVHTETPEPGWTAGQILVRLVQDSQLRSEIVDVTLDFNNSIDSNGDAWDTDRINRSWRVGSDLLDVLQQLIANGVDADMNAGYLLHVWKHCGDDLSGSVEIELTDCLDHTPETDASLVRNSILVRYGERFWTLVEDSASIAAHGRKSASITAGSTDGLAQATTLGQQMLDEMAHPQVTITIQMTSEKGPQPYDAFGLGDVITAPGLDGEPAPLRVMSFAASETENYIQWTVKMYPENP